MAKNAAARSRHAKHPSRKPTPAHLKKPQPSRSKQPPKGAKAGKKPAPAKAARALQPEAPPARTGPIQSGVTIRVPGKAPEAGGRRGLEEHVVDVQHRIRSCAGCGLCCTETYNTVQILPVEGDVIVKHLERLTPQQQREFSKRLEATVKKYGLEDDDRARRYTCAFLEADFTCSLPLQVKPVACLSFNPIQPNACDQEADWYHRAHEAIERRNTIAKLPNALRAIPVAVLRALRRVKKK